MASRREAPPPFPTDGDGTMNTAIAVPGNTADTFLVHFFGGGLADERYVVERFKAHADGDIRPWPGEAPAKGKGRRPRRGSRAGVVRLAPRRRIVWNVRRHHHRRRFAVRALRPRRDRALSEQERRPA